MQRQHHTATLRPLPQPRARAARPLLLGSGPSPFEASRQPSKGRPESEDPRPDVPARRYKFEPIVAYLTSKGAPGAAAGSKAERSARGELDRGAPGFLPSPPCPNFAKNYLCN